MSRFATIEGNAPPKDASAADIMARDGVRLRVGMFPREHAKGTFLVLTGWSEFIEKYFETIGELHARGFAAIAMDWRGQGLSERFASRPTTSHIDSFSLYKDDIGRLIEFAEEKQLPKPYYALTHSMGGAPMLQRLADGETRLRAAVLCAPLTALAFNRLETNAIRVLARSAVALRLGNTSVPGQPDTIPPFDETALTSDPERYQLYAGLLSQERGHLIRRQTFGWVNAALNASDDLHREHRFKDLKADVLIISAGLDRLVSSSDHASLAERSEKIEQVQIDNARHEILIESDAIRAVFWKHVDDFLVRIFEANDDR